MERGDLSSEDILSKTPTTSHNEASIFYDLDTKQRETNKNKHIK